MSRCVDAHYTTALDQDRLTLLHRQYLWDVTVTHSDLKYMQKHYVTEHSEDLNSTQRDDDKEAQKQFAFAREEFQPIYYIKSYEQDKKKIEMSFDL